MYHIGGVMANMLTSNVIDRGFEPKTTKLEFVASLHTALRNKSKDLSNWLGIRIMCLTGATCLTTDS